MGKIKTLLTGGIIGAVLGVLFAPQKGEETRKKLQGESDKLSDKAKKISEEVKTKVNEFKGKAQEMFGEKK